MKKIKYCLLLAFGLCWTGGEVWAQSYGQSEDYRDIDFKKLDLEGYRKKAFERHCKELEKCKQTVKENPKDERAWDEYANTLSVMKGDGTASDSLFKIEYPIMLEGMKKHIPHTATYELAKNDDPNEKNGLSYDEIIDKYPDSFLHYSTYITVSSREEERLKKLCQHWYRSGQYPPERLNYAYNLLASTEENALVFAGPLDYEPMLVLQLGKGLFQDRTILMATFALSDMNRPFFGDELTKKLGIPPYKEKEDETEPSSPAQFAEMYVKQIKQRANYIIRHVNRPVYFSASGGNMFEQIALKDSLYSEGLLFKYSAKPYDNLAVIRRNFEHTYLLDYLKESFHPETLSSSYGGPKRINWDNLYYIPAFRSLLKFYKESGDRSHYEELDSLLRSIIDRADYATPEVREEYLNSINNL